MNLDIVHNFNVGLFDIYEARNRSTVFINEEITFIVVQIGQPRGILFWSHIDVEYEDHFESENEIKNYTVTFMKEGDVIANVYTHIPDMYPLFGLGGLEDSVDYPFTVISPGCISSLFIKSYRDQASPMTVLISALPSVTGRIQLDKDCNVTLDFHFHWELWRSSGNANGGHQWIELAVDQPNSIRFQLSQAIVDHGLHRLTLTLKMPEDNITDSIYIQVNLPPVVAGIAGGHTRQVGYSNQVTLDAETESYDPADTHSLGLQFSWTCYKVQDGGLQKYTAPFNTDFSYRSFPTCNILLPAQGRISVPTSSLSIGDLILLEVTVSKQGRDATTATGIEVISTDVPVILLK